MSISETDCLLPEDTLLSICWHWRDPPTLYTTESGIDREGMQGIESSFQNPRQHSRSLHSTHNIKLWDLNNQRGASPACRTVIDLSKITLLSSRATGHERLAQKFSWIFKTIPEKWSFSSTSIFVTKKSNFILKINPF